MKAIFDLDDITREFDTVCGVIYVDNEKPERLIAPLGTMAKCNHVDAIAVSRAEYDARGLQAIVEAGQGAITSIDTADLGKQYDFNPGMVEVARAMGREAGIAYAGIEKYESADDERENVAKKKPELYEYFKAAMTNGGPDSYETSSCGVQCGCFVVQEEDIELFPELEGVKEVLIWDGGIETKPSMTIRDEIPEVVPSQKG